MAEALASHARLMCFYDNWAHRNLVAQIRALSADAYMAHAGLCFRSMHGVLTHLLLGARLWRYRMEGKDYAHLSKYWASDYSGPSDESSPWEAAFSSLDELCRELEAESAGYLALIERLTHENKLLDEFEYKDSKGAVYKAVYSTTILHVFNHSTHHRGQISAAITRFGGRPPLVDLPYFIRERDAWEISNPGKTWQLQPLSTSASS